MSRIQVIGPPLGQHVRNVASAPIDSPDDIGGLAVWLKADALTLNNDDPVASFTDSSGNGRHFTQATEANKPVFKTSIQNGLAVVRFDGSNDFLDAGDLSAAFPSAATMVCLVNVTGSSASDRYAVYRSNANDSHWRYIDGEGYWGVFRTSRIGGYPASGLPNYGTGYHTWVCRSSGSTYQLRLDGSDYPAQSAGFAGGTNHRIGFNEGQGYYTGMDFAEMCLYDSVLNFMQISALESYLGTKWGL